MVSALSGARTLSETGQAVLKSLRDLGFERAAFDLRSENGTREPCAVRNIPADLHEAVAQRLFQSADSGCLRSNILDVQRAGAIATCRPGLERLGIRRVAQLPCGAGRRVVGALILYVQAGRRPTAADLRHLDTIAECATLVVERLRREQLSERQNTEHAAFVEQSRRLASLAARQRAHLEALVAQVPGVVWEAWGQPDAANQRIDFVSRYVEQMVGYTVEEWLRTPNLWLTIVHPDDRERAAAEASAIFAGQRPGISEFRWVTRDGRTLWVEAQSTVIRDDAGRPIGMRGVTMDISERKRVDQDRTERLQREQLAREQAEMAEHRSSFLADLGALLTTTLDYRATLQVVVEQAVPILADFCSVFLVGVDGSIRLGACAHHDPERAEALRQLARLYAVDAATSSSQLARIIRSGRSLLLTGAALVSAEDQEDKAELEILLRVLEPGLRLCVPLTARGRTFGVLCFGMADSGRTFTPADIDLAEEVGRRVALAADNARLYADAEEANRLKDEFLATASHELRTPVNAILGWAQLLRAGRLGEAKAARALEAIERNAEIQAQLIADLLDVSRIITGKLRLEPEAVPVDSLIDTMLDSVRPGADSKGIRLGKTIAPGVDHVTADPARLQQVIWNLLSNAIKFTPPGGEVHIEVSSGHGEVRIKVRDSGIGIRPEFLPYVFDRFRQEDASTTRTHGGLGLGLSIVRHLVELHGGTVAVESPGEGRGATFIVRLPIQSAGDRVVNGVCPPAPSSILKGSEDMTAVAGSLAGLTVLAVDDLPEARELFSTLLEAAGARVITAASAAEALEAVNRERPDLLIADVAMPSEDGYSLIQRVRRLPPERGGETPAIAVTAHALDDDRSRALGAGFQLHLSKPLTPARLLRAISSLIPSGKLA